LLHDDYLMRLLRPFVAAIAQILFLTKEREAQKALQVINTTSEKLLGLNAALLTLLSDRYLLDLLEKDTDYGALRCVILAALLKQEADVYAMMGDEDAAITRRIKALHIYMQILPIHAVPDAASHLPLLIDIADHLRGFAIDPDLRRALQAYFESQNQYAQAENIVFDLIETSPDTQDAIINGITFYQRLLTLHPQRLAAGGLPRAEVEAGLAELMQRGNDPAQSATDC
jgi:hypothetical protein